MNLVNRALALVDRRAWSPQPIDNLDAWIDTHAGLSWSAAGVVVSPEAAMRLVPFYAAVRVLSTAVASCPLITYRRQPNGGRIEATGHDLYDLLRRLPNPEMTAFEFWETAMGHLLLWGNFYAELERNPYGVTALWPLRPDRMAVGRDTSDNLVYLYRPLPNDPPRLFRFDDVLHVKGQMLLDVLTGRSPASYGAEAIGLGLAAESFGARFFGNDSRPGGILTVDGRLSDEAAERLRTSWESMHAGGHNRWRVAVLENGVTWQAIGVPPEDAQLLQTRQFQRAEIAGLTGVPLHMLGDLSRATWANIEHQGIEFADYAVEPWTTRIEQCIWRDVFRVSPGKRSHEAEFDTRRLKQGDAKTRSESFAIMRQNGVINADEWRQAEGLNPVGGEIGSAYLVNGNMIGVARAVAPPEPPAAPPSDMAPDMMPDMEPEPMSPGGNNNEPVE